MILNREFDFLIDGISNISNPYLYFCLSTINNKRAQSRTIVLRDVDKSSIAIYFNADYRSPKIKQLLLNNLCSILFYDNKRKVQIRSNCQAYINNNNNKAKEQWLKTPLQSRKCYMGEYSPSQILNKWHPNIPLKYLKKDPEKKDSESGYYNFSFVKLVIKKLDILELHHDGHIRFSVDVSKNITFIAP